MEVGKELVIGLHDELFTGILALYLRDDLPCKPHIGLGLFSKEDYERARKEFEDMNLELWCTIDQWTLLRINAEFTQ